MGVVQGKFGVEKPKEPVRPPTLSDFKPQDKGTKFSLFGVEHLVVLISGEVYFLPLGGTRAHEVLDYEDRNWLVGNIIRPTDE